MKGCGTFSDAPRHIRKRLPDHVAAFGKALRQLRLAHGLSMGDLARLFDASVVKVSNVEVGTETVYVRCKSCSRDVPVCQGPQFVFYADHTRSKGSKKECRGSGLIAPYGDAAKRRDGVVGDAAEVAG